MDDQDWLEIRHFRKSDNWGDPQKMDKALLLELDAYREYLGTPILVSCGTDKQHLEDSQHYLGRAVDILFPDSDPKMLMDRFITATRFKFQGIGIYPDWMCEGKKIGGLHLDTRDDPGHRSLWMGVKDGMRQRYVSLSVENLKAYGLL